MKVKPARIRRLTSCCLLLLLLSGCGIADTINERTYDAIDGPETVTIDGVVYRNGFYGDMNPMFGEKGSIGSETLQDEIVYDDGQYRYRRVDYAGHDWVHSDGGRTTGGVLYCAEEDWEDVSAYYADPSNLDYLMGTGKYIAGDSVSAQLVSLFGR